jgi:hypothetical protein
MENNIVGPVSDVAYTDHKAPLPSPDCCSRTHSASVACAASAATIPVKGIFQSVHNKNYLLLIFGRRLDAYKFTGIID